MSKQPFLSRWAENFSTAMVCVLVICAIGGAMAALILFTSPWIWFPTIVIGLVAFVTAVASADEDW